MGAHTKEQCTEPPSDLHPDHCSLKMGGNEQHSYMLTALQVTANSQGGYPKSTNSRLGSYKNTLTEEKRRTEHRDTPT